MSTALLLLSLHGLLLTLLLVAGRARDPANGLLGGLALVASALLWSAWLQQERGGWSAVLASLLAPAWYLVGPLSLRYVQRFLGQPPTTSLGWLAVAPLAAAAWMLGWQLQPAAVQGNTAARLIHVGVLYSAFWSLTAVCAWQAWRLIRAAEPIAKPPWHRAWLQLLTAWLAVYSLLDLVMTLSFVSWGSYPAWLGHLSVLLLSALIYAIAVLALMPDGLMRRAPWPGKPYQRAELPEGAAAELGVTLERHMREQRPWLADDLDLTTLAGAIGCTPHQLSQLLSQHLHSSFADYVNGYRVEHAKALLATVQARSILDVGFESGFGSSASFYRAFRKHAGATPRAYQATAVRPGQELTDTSRARNRRRAGGTTAVPSRH